MTRTFRALFAGLRRQALDRGAEFLFRRERASDPVLSRYASVAAVLAMLDEESSASWSEREAVTRALIALHQRARHSLWASVLLVAYYPMLSRLRHRIYGERLDRHDLDQLVLAAFLQVVATFPGDLADRTALRLRQRTERAVFKAIRLEQQTQRAGVELTWKEEPATELEQDEEVESVDVEPNEMVVRLLGFARRHLPSDRLDVVVATTLRRERLRSYAARMRRHGEPSERVYQRLKRQRTRTMHRLRALLERARWSQSDARGLDELR